MEGETDDDEQDGEKGEAHQLDRFTPNGVDSEDGDPVTRDSTTTNEDEVSDGVVVELLIDVILGSISDLSENDRVVKTQTVEGHIEQKP